MCGVLSVCTQEVDASGPKVAAAESACCGEPVWCGAIFAQGFVVFLLTLVFVAEQAGFWRGGDLEAPLDLQQCVLAARAAQSAASAAQKYAVFLPIFSRLLCRLPSFAAGPVQSTACAAQKLRLFNPSVFSLLFSSLSLAVWAVHSADMSAAPFPLVFLSLPLLSWAKPALPPPSPSILVALLSSAGEACEICHASNTQSICFAANYHHGPDGPDPRPCH